MRIGVKLAKGLIYCVATYLLVSCSDDAGHTTSVKSQVERGLPGDPRSLDPSEADDTFSLQVLRDTWEGLTNFDEQGRVVPGVAKDWSVDATGTIYEFHLRHDARWSDGADVVAQQFVDGFRHSVTPSTASGSAEQLSVIKSATEILASKKPPAALGVQALDNYTLRLELERPAPFVLQILAEPICAPRRADRAGTSTSMVTEGPYTVTDRRPGAYILLKSNPQYWDRTNVHLESVRYVIAESESSELQQYLANQLDLTYTLPLSDLKRLEADHSDEIQTGPILGTMYLALNLSNREIGGDKNLREALSIAIDRESITRDFTLGATPAFNLVAQGVLNYSSFKYSWANLSRAQQIALAKSNYEKSGYSLDHPLKLTLYFNNNESIKRIMVAIADSWKRNLGVETVLLGEEFRVFLDGRKDRSKWDVARLGWLADYNDASSFLEIFTTSGIQNDPGYNNEAFNGLIYKARGEPSEPARAQVLSEAEAQLLNDYPIIPVYFYTAKHLVKRTIHGATISPMNRTYSRLLSQTQG